VRRLSRFLANSAIDVHRWYKPIAKGWLQSQFERVGEIRLMVDGTKIGFGHQLLMVSLAFRHRAVPIPGLGSRMFAVIAPPNGR